PGTVRITAYGVVNGIPFSVTAQLTVTNAIATSLLLTPGTATVPAGFEQQFTATALLSDGSVLDVTDNAVLSWSSSNPGIATISNTEGSKGLATGIATGTVTITASGIANGKPFSATVSLEVTQATAISLQVTPARATVPVGLEQQFTAMAQLSDGRELEVTDNAALSWSSSDPTIATISNTVGSKGLATGVSPGSVIITASGISNGIAFERQVNVTISNAIATSLQLTPTAASVPAGLEQQFIATALLSDGSVLDVTDNAVLSWSTSDPMIATISNIVGSKGLVTGVTSGSVTIIASGVANGVPFAATTQLDVTDATITSLRVTPTQATLPIGMTQQFTAIATLSDGRNTEITNHPALAWRSENSSIATVDNTNRKGLVTGVGGVGRDPGETAITVAGMLDGNPYSASASVIVMPNTINSIVVNGMTTSGCSSHGCFPKMGFVGATFTLSVGGLMSNNRQYDWSVDASWLSVDNGKVIFDAKGDSTPVTITATPKADGSVATYTFALQKWFVNGGAVQLSEVDADTWCANRGYRTPAANEVTNGTIAHPDGSRTASSNQLWSGWGSMSVYAHGWFSDAYWVTRLMSTPTNVLLNTSGTVQLVTEDSSHHVMCVDDL
ncbi:Ig-like domain-containing protein, partial [Aeromonas dhakensis]